MSKEYYRNQIAQKRKDVISLRAKIARIKEDKKRKMASLTASIKSASGAFKESYRRQKVSESTRYDNEVETLKKQIESVKRNIENLKVSLSHQK